MAPPPSRFDSPRAATAVVLVVVGLLGAVVAGLSRFEGGASAPAPDLVTDEIAVSIPPGWTWAGGSETEPAGHGVIAHLLSFGAAGDELSLPIEGGFPLEVADLPAGQASVLITVWETGTPPVPDPVVGRPHGLDADRFIGGAAAAFRLRRFADGATAWWQLSPPGFPDRWIEVSATINGLPREQDERLAEIDAILESLEFRGG